MWFTQYLIYSRHHLFLKCLFLPPCLFRVRCLPSTYPSTLPIQGTTKILHVILYTLAPIPPAPYSPPHILQWPPHFYRPNHLSLPRLATSVTLCTSKRLHKTSFRFLSFRDTPHIHLTIVRSPLFLYIIEIVSCCL